MKSILDKIDLKTKIRLAIIKISHQFDSSAESKLMLAIITQAIRDLSGTHLERTSASRYLSCYIPHAEIANVDSVWIQNVISKCGINLDEMK